MGKLEGGHIGGEQNIQGITVYPNVLSSSELQEIRIKTQDNIDNLKQSITYEQFNKSSDKLSLVTRYKIKSKDIVEGIKIKFQFPNKEIYLQSSAGSVIPGNVIELEAGGKTWKRDEYNKEFFYSNNKDGTIIRLIIGSFANHSKGRYSEVTILKIKGSIQESIRSKKQTQSIKSKIEKVKDNTPIKESIIKTTSSKVENLLGNNLSAISDIENINFLKLGDFINFDFPNKESYLKTSAGSIVPKNINNLKTLDGQIWNRKDGKGEFYNKNDRRLIIGDKKFIRGYPSVQIVDKLESLKVNSYGELLKLPINYRLQNVSDFVGKSNNLKEGVEINIDFSKGIGLGKASLGEVMPVEVRSIEKDGKIYTRLLNDETVKGNITKSGGEFLDENMNRLRVNTGDNITILKIETIEEIQNDINNHNKKVSSPEYKSEIKSIINSLSKQYKIPTKYIDALLDGENIGKDYLSRGGGKNNTAFGLLQINNPTWIDITERFRKKGLKLDRYNYIDQLKAGIEHMFYIKNRQNCSWDDVLAYYHTGLGILDKKVKEVQNYYDENPPIANIISGKIENGGMGISRDKVNANVYFAGAKRYYSSKLV